MGIFLAMFIGLLIGSALLMVGSLFISMWINTLLFGSEYNHGGVLLIWFGIIMLVLSFVFGIVECRSKARKLHGRKNPKAIDEL